MKKQGSEKNLYIESDDDDNDEEKVNDEREGDDSDSMDSDSVGSARRSRQSSYATQWPQSYRQSIDMYSNVASPNIGFLGTPIKRLNSSYLVSSLQRLHTPEILVPFIKPLLTTESTQQQEPYPLIPPDQKKDAKTFHEVPIARQCSYSQAVLNGINVLCGVGLLSMPYAIKEGGWAGLGVLFLFGIFSFYTGLLLRHCLDSEPGLETYPDIGQAAFGTYGRIAISIILYVELYACCVEYIILESDNLSALFPNAQIELGGLVISSHYLFAFMTALAVLPTVWLRDLSVLSYISVGGVVASILVSICLLWMGVFDNTGFQHKGTILNLTNLPVALGLYGYCYSGHAVFPNIYSSMKNPNQYPAVLLTSFLFCTILYAGVAATGYTMYGDSIKSQFTLNLPDVYVASKIAIWTTVVNPFTKFALTMTPVALCLEELVPSSRVKFKIYSLLIRAALVISTLFVALSIPFFGYVMALIGSFCTMLVSLVLPCACFLRILRGKVTWFQRSFCFLIIIVGIVCAISGTYSAIVKIVQSLQ